MNQFRCRISDAEKELNDMKKKKLVVGVFKRSINNQTLRSLSSINTA